MQNLFTLVTACALSASAFAQSGSWNFDPTIEITDYAPETVVMPASPLQFQVIFIGGEHMVQTVDANGAPDGETPAKQWHDFIGFTPDENSEDLGWVSVNHEMILADDKIGDGGGMTVFKVKRDPDTDTLMVVEQTLADGRQGMFFNVDFVNTVGETGMNCGGINTADGRIWTAEEWYQSNNVTINTYYGTAPDYGIRDTADVTISSDVDGSFDGTTIPKWQSLNYMVEIDPREAKAIRKQYNWGKMGFEGGTVMEDNKTVYLGVDNTPAAWVKFVADVAGDFTSGSLYVYRENAAIHWVQVDNGSFQDALDVEDNAWAEGASMYNRIEWVARSTNGKIYFTETGRDNPGGRWIGEHTDGGEHANHHMMRALQQGTHPDSSDYVDYYGRVMEFDPETNEMRVFLAGGPEYLGTSDVPMNQYPDIHLSNPDGLSFLRSNGREYMIVQEDLNGNSYGRTPGGVTNRLCEVFLLDMEIENPTYSDLIRISAVPEGAEVTGARATPDGKTILLNSQHPSTGNPYPYNNSLTYAITGWDDAIATGLLDRKSLDANGFQVYPNPATREIQLNKVSDIAIYNMQGQRIKVARQVTRVDVSELPTGTYFVQNAEGNTLKLIVE